MIIALFIVLSIAIIFIERRNISIERKRAAEQLLKWKEEELTAMRQQVNTYYLLQFEKWKNEYENKIRKDAVKKSESVTIGKVTEHLIPFFPQFTYNPKDARFVGSPVDLVIFDGLNSNKDIDVIFAEVKTGQSTLNGNERRIRDAIQNKRVRWISLSPEEKDNG
jgi:predicted Holliday junction resolvase-like endonuclease